MTADLEKQAPNSGSPKSPAPEPTTVSGQFLGAPRDLSNDAVKTVHQAYEWTSESRRDASDALAYLKIRGSESN